MRFRLIGMFVVVTLIAVLCGITFALPLVASVSLLALLFLISPGIWISGAVFAKGSTRAFFLGGLIAGILPFTLVPFVAALSTSNLAELSTQAQELPEPSGDASDGPPADDHAEQVLVYRLAALGFWLLPGVISFSGGGLAWLTYRMLHRAGDQKSSAKSESGSMLNYHVIEGRLTTSPVPPENVALRGADSTR